MYVRFYIYIYVQFFINKHYNNYMTLLNACSRGWCCVNTLVLFMCVHVGVWSFMLSLSLSIVCVVFPSLALCVFMFLLLLPTFKRVLPLCYLFLFRFVTFDRFLVLFLSCHGDFPSCLFCMLGFFSNGQTLTEPKR